MILITSILLLCVNRVLCIDCVLQGRSRDVNEEIKLDEDLLCNYDVSQSPMNNTKGGIRFILKRFSLDSTEEIFTMYSWLFLDWMDERLQWDPKKYDGITETLLEDYRIWTPKFKHKNNIVYEDFEAIFNTTCQVHNPGHVICIRRVISQSECSTNLTNWPYDTQSCTVKFGIYTDITNNVIFTFNSTRGISMFGAEYGPGWNIIDFDKGENKTYGTQFYFTFVLERQGEILEALTIAPSMVLPVLTVSTLFLDVGHTRGGIGILSLICHYYTKTFLNINIPYYSPTVPSIVRFIVASLIVTTISIILTFFLSFLREKDVTPQMWITSVTEFVFKSPMRFFIWPRWEARNVKSETDETRQANEIWSDFANVVNSASIAIIVITYVSIYFSYMPKQLPIND